MSAQIASKNAEEKSLFDQYMDFKSPTPFQEVWSEKYFSDAFNVLALQHVTINDQHVDAVKNCYKNKNGFRSYHGPDHGAFVGQNYLPEPLTVFYQAQDRGIKSNRAKAWATIAGIFHDTVYKNVDADWNSVNAQGKKDYKGAWRHEVRDAIGKYADFTVREENGKPVFTTYLTDKGKIDSKTQMVARIFGMTDDGMIHNQGGNEFDSALYAVKFMEKLEEENETKLFTQKDYIAVTAAIAATVPFKAATNIKPGTQEIIPDMPEDGHMGIIAAKVAKEIEKINDSNTAFAWQATNEIMPVAVHIANRDIAPFILKDNAAQVIKGGRDVKQEERPELRDEKSDIQSLANSAALNASAPLLYEWFSKEPFEEGIVVPVENVPHIYYMRDDQGQIPESKIAYPPKEIYEEAVANARENTKTAALYFKAHEVGITFAASMAAIRDSANPNPEIIDIVNAEAWNKNAYPIPNILSARELNVFEILEGKEQTQTGNLPARSPISAFILRAVGEEGIEKFSQIIDKIRNTSGNIFPFSEPENAEELIDALKKQMPKEGFDTLITELHRIAAFNEDKPWMEKLKSMGNIKTYSYDAPAQIRAL